LRAEKILQDRLFANEKIKVIWDSEVVEFVGGGDPEALVGLDIRNKHTGEVSRVDCEGAFVAIGHKPATELFEGQLDLDATAISRSSPARPRPASRASSRAAT
jgi:thioredoxin reductase (NADPH)